MKPDAALSDLQVECIASLESLAIALDPFYDENFERPHRVLCKALTDYRRGLPVTLLDGSIVEPKNASGFSVWFPRDTFKSAIICELYPIWLSLYWVFEKRSQPAIYIFQAKLDKAQLHLAKIKRLMCSPAFRSLFGSIVPSHANPENWGTQSQCDIAGIGHLGRREHSIQIASIGAVFTGHHGTDIINDDGVTEENYASETEQLRVFTGWQLQDNLRDTKTGLRYFVGTPYQPRDANVRVMQGELGDTIQFRMPAFVEPPDTFFEWASNRTPQARRDELRPRVEADYTLKFPGRLTLDELGRKFRSQGSKIFTSQQLLEATDTSKTVFRKEWLANAYVTIEEIRKRCTRFIMVIDSAWKRQENKGTGDDTSIGVVGYDRDGDVYFADLFVSDTCTEIHGYDIMHGMIKRWNCVRIFKERFGEDSFATRWRDWCKSKGYKITPVIQPDRVGTAVGKENRIRAMAPYVEDGHLFVREDLPYLHEFTQQFSQYAGEGSGKDDILDMLADAVRQEVKPATPRPTGDAEQSGWQSPYHELRHVSTGLTHSPTRNVVSFDPDRKSGWTSMRARLS